MQNKNKVVLPEVGVSWRTTPNTKRSLNFLIFTTFSLVFHSYRKIKTKDCCVFTKFLVLLGFYTCFSNILKIKNNRPFFHKFSSSWNYTLVFSNQKSKQRMLWFHEFFFLTFFFLDLHWSFTHINNQNTVDNFCIFLANCKAYTL